METLLNHLREYLLDLEEFNELNMDEQTLPDPLLKGAIEDGVNEYDLVLPLSDTEQATLIADLKGKTWYLVKQFCACNALDRVIMNEIRNRNPVNDAGFQVDEHDKAPDWTKLVSLIRERLVPMTLKYKRSLGWRGFRAETISGCEPVGT